MADISDLLGGWACNASYANHLKYVIIVNCFEKSGKYNLMFYEQKSLII